MDKEQGYRAEMYTKARAGVPTKCHNKTHMEP